MNSLPKDLELIIQNYATPSRGKFAYDIQFQREDDLCGQGLFEIASFEDHICVLSHKTSQSIHVYVFGIYKFSFPVPNRVLRLMLTNGYIIILDECYRITIFTLGGVMKLMIKTTTQYPCSQHVGLETCRAEDGKIAFYFRDFERKQCTIRVYDMNDGVLIYSYNYTESSGDANQGFFVMRKFMFDSNLHFVTFDKFQYHHSEIPEIKYAQTTFDYFGKMKSQVFFRKFSSDPTKKISPDNCVRFSLNAEIIDVNINNNNNRTKSNTQSAEVLFSSMQQDLWQMSVPPELMGYLMVILDNNRGHVIFSKYSATHLTIKCFY